MTDLLTFVALVLVILLAYMAYKLRGQSWREYFSTRDGKGVLRGIVLAPIIIIVIGLILMLIPGGAEAQGRWFNDASVFAGIDYTKKQSPQCARNTTDNRGTSNLGLRLNVWESSSGNVRLNSKYTHHSCVLGKDDRQYDALGVELEWRVWQRRR